MSAPIKWDSNLLPLHSDRVPLCLSRPLSPREGFNAVLCEGHNERPQHGREQSACSNLKEVNLRHTSGQAFTSQSQRAAVVIKSSSSVSVTALDWGARSSVVIYYEALPTRLHSLKWFIREALHKTRTSDYETITTLFSQRWSFNRWTR